MGAGRVEAFSDGVIAIIITIMVLELKVPAERTIDGFSKVAPVFISYGMSYLVVAIMWVNHHSLIGTVSKVDAPLLWSNNNLLFWMSLIPFATAYAGRHPGEPLSVATYGAVLAMSAFGFTVLRLAIARHHRESAALAAQHRKSHRKNVMGTLLYAASAGLAFVSVYASYVIFILIPVFYFLPERLLVEHRRE
jgi:uncharacterized membrane protein